MLRHLIISDVYLTNMYGVARRLSIRKRTHMFVFAQVLGGKVADPKDAWVERAKRLMKAELKRAGVSYEELAKRLGEMGLHETVGSITVKVNRGAYPAWFLFAVMKAINRQVVRLDES